MEISRLVLHRVSQHGYSAISFSTKPFAITSEYMEDLHMRQGRYQEEVAPKKAVHLTMITVSGIVDNPQKYDYQLIDTLHLSFSCSVD